MYSDKEMNMRQREVYLQMYTEDGPDLSMSLLVPALASGAKAGSCVCVCRKVCLCRMNGAQGRIGSCLNDFGPT
jgi:hypothetical protein